MAQVLIPRKSPIINRPSGIPILNRDSPQAEGLVGWWPGTLDFRNVFNGKARLAEDTLPSTIVTREGRAQQFVEANTNAVLVNGAITGANPRTYFLRCYINAFQTNFSDTLFGNDFASTSSGQRFLVNAEDNAISVLFQNHRLISATTALSTGVLYDIVVGVMDGASTTDDIFIYIDGINQSLNDEAGAAQTLDTQNATMAIGAATSNGGATWIQHSTFDLIDFRMYDQALNDSIINAFTDPATRWDLYWRPRKLVVVSVPAPAGAATQNIASSLLEDSDTLNHGEITTGTANIAGSSLTDVDNLYHGEITATGAGQDIEGSLFSDADDLFHGLITLDIEGTLLSDADILYHGQIDVGTFNIQGSLFSDADNLYHGLISEDIAGSLLSDADILYHGEIATGAVDIQGSLFSDADTFYHGLITENIEGTLLEDADVLYHGLIETGTFDLQGSLFEDSDNLYHGEIAVGTVNIEGSFHQDADVLNHGKIAVDIKGSFLSDADQLNHGTINVGAVNIQSTILIDSDTLYHGEIAAGTIALSGSLLEDADILHHGAIGKIIAGSPLEDDDELYHGLITTGSFNMNGSLFEDEDIINDGLILGGVQVAVRPIRIFARTGLNGEINYYIP